MYPFRLLVSESLLLELWTVSRLQAARSGTRAQTLET